MKSLVLTITLLGFSFAGINPARMATQSLTLASLSYLTASPGLRGTIDGHPINTFEHSLPTPTLKHIIKQYPTRSSFPLSSSPTPVPTPQDDQFSDLLLPDLQTLPPTDLHLVNDANSGRSLIRFSNSIWNRGPGKLELIGTTNQSRDRIQVSQKVYAADQESFDQIEVGEFIFHNQHNHWHLEQFALYEVWSVDEKGNLDSVASSGGKVSYCIMDISPIETDHSGDIVSPNRSYTSCRETRQGLSVGWIDTYKSHFWGQWVDVTSLEDGIYALVSTVDPDHLLTEADINNNTGLTYFGIREKRLRIVEKHLFEYDEYLIPNSYRKP